MQAADPRFRYVYAVWAFLETTGFAGVIIGWGSLVYVFKDEGLYSNLCHNGTDNGSIGYQESGLNSTDDEDKTYWSSRPCHAQDAMLNLVFSVASSFYCLAALAFGQINYKFGTRVSRLLATVVFTTGSVAMAFTSNDTPWLIFPGTCLLGAGGLVYKMTNIQISLLFPSAGVLFIGLLVGGYEASTGVSQIIKLGYEQGISRRTSFLILGITQLLTLVSTFLFLPKGFIKKPEDDTKVLDRFVETSDPQENSEKLPPLKSVIFSPTFVLHLYWMVVLEFRYMFVLSTLNVTLERLLLFKEEVRRYTNITAYILMAGVVTSPAVGAFCDFQAKLFRGSTLGVCMSICILLEKAELLYLVFILMLLLRGFLFNTLTGLLVAVYPNEYFVFLMGIVRMACGAVNLLQNPLLLWATRAGFGQVNTLLLVLTASTFIHPLYQWWAVRTERPVPTSMSTADNEDSFHTGSDFCRYNTFSTSPNGHDR